MASKIRVLTEHTINKIAAGEVIENPASVVKELVENSLDAGSRHVRIEIKGGGRQLVRITDDGCGMNEDDALLSLERHATSKISEVEDILGVGTLGFRGEAVPSIASISKFTLVTCTDGSAEGTMVLVDGGKILKVCPAARSVGTTVEVKNFFFNVPARRKFQRSPAHDSGEVLKVVTSLALANPHVRFDLVSNQESVLSTPARDSEFLDAFAARVASVLGDSFVQRCCRIDAEHEGYAVQGLIGLPSHSRPNRTGQHLFVNGRAVVSTFVSLTVRDSYGTSLPTQRHPVFALHLTLPGDRVDVNVHPQKREVRLRHGDAVKELIYAAVDDALREHCVVAAPVPSPAFTMPAPEPSHVQPTASPRTPNLAPLPLTASLPWESAPETEVVIVDDEPEPEMALAFEEPAAVPTVEWVDNTPHSQKVLTTVPGYFVLEARGTELTIIDQRAAHHRVLFEKMDGESGVRETAVQQLLIPKMLDLTPSEAATLRQALPTLQLAGLGIEEFGPNSFKIDAVPQALEGRDLDGLLSEIIDEIRQHQRSERLQAQSERFRAKVSARLAVSRRKHFSVEEAQHLVDTLFACKQPATCPLGNATYCKVDHEALSKLFA